VAIFVLKLLSALETIYTLQSVKFVNNYLFFDCPLVKWGFPSFGALLSPKLFFLEISKTDFQNSACFSFSWKIFMVDLP